MNAALWAFGGMVLLATMGAGGGAEANSPVYDKCIDRSEGVTSAMRDCAGVESSRQDRELNAIYKQAMASRDTAGREQLRTQERAWLKTRDARCELSAQPDAEGTLGLIEADDCWIDLTDKRITALRALAGGRP
jgi:uncharacterized protein YecT (DUF1311 family)